MLTVDGVHRRDHTVGVTRSGSSFVLQHLFESGASVIEEVIAIVEPSVAMLEDDFEFRAGILIRQFDDAVIIGGFFNHAAVRHPDLELSAGNRFVVLVAELEAF